MSEDASSNAASGSSQSAIHGCVAAAVIQDRTSMTFAPEPAATADAAGGSGRADVNRSCGIMDRGQLVRALSDVAREARGQSRAWARDMCEIKHSETHCGEQ